ncbi:peptidase [Lignipirellula cremea]|nr:peptidase [Lignipirellula cremea]
MQVALFCGCMTLALPGWAATVTLKNGVQLEGRLGHIAHIGENPELAANNNAIKQIVLLDDDLRRMFVSSMQARALAPAGPMILERIKIDQRVANGNRRVGGVGPILRITSFDDFGRRIFSMSGPRGRVDVIQGITEITPTYTKVEGLAAGSGLIWDMRIATSSIPRETLSKVLLHQMDPENPDHRLQVVRLYIQAERYGDAHKELAGIIEDFPELNAKKWQAELLALRQHDARRFITEIELRKAAGQHDLAIRMLRALGAQPNVAGAILVQVRNMLEEYQRNVDLVNKANSLIKANIDLLPDADLKAKVEPIQAEIAADLNLETLLRMADFLRLAEGDTHGPDQKLALAISGWLLGSGAGTENLAVALSAYETRNLVRGYLSAERDHERADYLAQIKMQEAGAPNFLAKILYQMKPPYDPPQTAGQVPGMYTLQTPGLTGEPDITYHVQLPPEYDPQRKYPCIVALNGAGVTPEHAIDWWAGSPHPESKARMGQAARRGYIVLAPVWARPAQTKYEYSAHEHAAVLYSLRDACKRFSINTDRVFLSGHSMGADAAWDIAIAHPDLWAGALPVVPTADKYIARYWENAEYVPLYFVMGEMDGDRMATNARDFERYLTKPNYDTIIVEYQGRGHENFSDEIQKFFEWMDVHERNFNQRKFECVSMRPWDNFFWWLEVSDLPERSMVSPLSWPPESGAIPVKIEGSVLETNGVVVKSGAASSIIYLTPEIVNFEERILINGRSQEIKPDAEVMLKDVRSRVDRQHPFWAKFELDGRRR